MDEDAYRKAHRTLGPIRCVYEKALVSQNALCASARQLWMADRIGFSCSSESDAETCRCFLQHLRQACGFLFGDLNKPEALTHNREMRVQCGGLIGLQALLAPTNTKRPVSNIRQLLVTAESTFEAPGKIPYSELMPYIADFNPRPRRKK